MKIRRLLLRDFRGVEERELRLEDGVTIVQGPNEVGKSSLAEAIDVLFEYRDDSRAKRVLALKPVDRDVGTEVELDAESGDYVFTYRKRFHRERRTELVVHAPSPENLTGRDAHDRALAILEETLDVALWKALRIHQGVAIRQAALDQSPSLATALDRAAGVGVSGTTDANESLFDAVTEEYLRYFTATGREKKTLTEPRTKVERLAGEVETLRERIASLERDVERAARIDDELEALRAREPGLREDARARHEEQHSIEALGERVVAAEARHQNAVEAVNVARQRLTRRAEQAARVDELERELAALSDDERRHAGVLAAFDGDLAEATTGLENRRAEYAIARARAELARVDLAHWTDRSELEELGRRRLRIDEAREAAADAQALLATTSVTHGAVERIRTAYNELLVSRAVLQGHSPQLRVEALADLTVELGGQERRMAAGATHTEALTGAFDLVLPGLLRASVEPGHDLEELRERQDAAHREYVEACGAIGVDDLETALALLERRRAAEARVAESERTVRSELGEGWSDQLDTRQVELQQRVYSYLRERESGERLPDSRDAARAAEHAAATTLDEARAAERAAAARVEGLHEKARETRQLHDRTATRRSISEKEGRVARESLAYAREQEADERLTAALEAAREREAELRASLEAARGEHRALGPDTIAARVANADAALASLLGEISALETERTEVGARLALLGEEGLAERLDDAEGRHEHAQREQQRLETRARSAALLYDTMRARRDEARRAYLGPLRERVEHLGRFVFGSDLAVELDEDLRITSRTAGGVTLPFESLSTGAREQLGVILRLACAMIVAGEGDGVPLILDDALGNSDPERLKEMGAVLGLAGKHTQVLLLTAAPERYLHVGGARVVRLDG